jgi:transposase InsO family protein
MGLSGRTIERWRRQKGGDDRREGPRRAPANKLGELEEQRFLNTLCSPEFRDLSPRQVVPELAERGVYIASESTAYRLLHKHRMQKHRESTRPAKHNRPAELVASAPNQVWCWDITYLRANILGTFYYLYLVSDLYSRRIVAARVYEAENDRHSSELFGEVCHSEGLAPGQVTLHSDNGGPMKGATLKATLERLGVLASYSRPSVSDDNPFAESLFRTLKTHVSYPRTPFASREEAQAWVDAFVAWYNHDHRHSALNWVTPSARHQGHDGALLALRRATYLRAKARHPHRWSGNIRNCNPAPPTVLNPSRQNDAAARHAA